MPQKYKPTVKPVTQQLLLINKTKSAHQGT